MKFGVKFIFAQLSQIALNFHNMKQFNLLYEQILDEMNRRDFLKTLGKGAKVVAGNKLMPGGIVGTALKGAMNVAAGAPPIDINKLTNKLLRIQWDGDEITGLRQTYAGILSFLTQKNLANNVLKNGNTLRDEINTVLSELDPKTIQSWVDNTEGHGQDILSTEDYYINFIESGEDHEAYEGIIKTLFTHNLMSPANAKFLEEMTGEYWFDYVDSPEAKIAREKHYKKMRDEAKKAMHQDHQIQTAKDIDYSRMDRAGSSEDAGYAKYYENYLKENYADGKNPGRKGLAKRSGVNTKASVSSLRKTAKHSTGEKARMAHWLANMKAGKKKAKKKRSS